MIGSRESMGIREARVSMEAEVGGGLPGERRGRRPVSTGTYCRTLHRVPCRAPGESACRRDRVKPCEKVRSGPYQAQLTGTTQTVYLDEYLRPAEIRQERRQLVQATTRMSFYDLKNLVGDPLIEHGLLPRWNIRSA